MKAFRIQRLAKHDRSNFDCGNDLLNRYLRQTASQDQRTKYAVCLLTIENATEAIAGYYSMSAGGVDLDRLPQQMVKRLPRYPAVPIVHIGRLAVDQEFQGQGIARWMLVDASHRVRSMDVGAFALTVDAKDAEAEAFYVHYGFTKLDQRDGDERTLVLPIRNAS